MMTLNMNTYSQKLDNMLDNMSCVHMCICTKITYVHVYTLHVYI